MLRSMDDYLVLNIASSDAPSRRASVPQKSGRWIDRLKEKRSLKRKVKPSTPSEVPQKKARTDDPAIVRPTQIISSLFSYNPKIQHPTEKPAVYKVLSPSNAPLDSSTFPGLGLNPLLISHLTNKMAIHKPTAIQQAALPILLSDSTTDRDIFIQSQTGSGKTLAYLLPIIQDLLPLSSLSYIDRSIGTLAIIIAPTRELAKQLSDVLETLLKMRLRLDIEAETEPDTSTRLTRWLVSGLLVGGATRSHEKAKLRKGIPILVSTPGRLLDHLQNTSSFNVGKCRWLILDEADQLMELGFEETIKGIIQALDGRRRLAKQAIMEGKSNEVAGWDWEPRRKTILCSATIREDVQKLAGTALLDPLVIRATKVEKDDNVSLILKNSTPSHSFTPPSQLLQKYIVVPLKLRLVALVALLRTLVAQTQVRKGVKIIVFLSCTDSVDFHWSLLGGSIMGGSASNMSSHGDSDSGDDPDGTPSEPDHLDPDGVETKCPLLPGAHIYRLHGSLKTHARLAALRGFSGRNKTEDAILFCTSVASRGLDLPLVQTVVQYDLPTEGGSTEYVHRVGRTARAGKGGEAWSFVAPSEVGWTTWIQDKMRGDGKEGSDSNISLSPVIVEEVLRSGFGGKGSDYEERATEVQLSFERWVMQSHDSASLARKAYLSHMRAYATHPSSEKHLFHIRHLHIGHLAKAFALREAPKAVKGAWSKPTKSMRKSRAQMQDSSDDESNRISEKRMQAVVRAQGRLTKRGGVMASTGISEFQVSNAAELERLLGR